MRAPERHQRALRRALLALASLHNDDRLWVIGQLSTVERQTLTKATDQLMVDENSTAQSFSLALEECATADASANRLLPAISLVELPDWLALRVLGCLDSQQRSDSLATVDWRRRWRLKRSLHRGDERAQLTPTTAAALLESVRGLQLQEPSSFQAG